MTLGAETLPSQRSAARRPSVRCRGAVVQTGDFRLGPVDLDVRVADRVAILGRNGSGKTTLLSLLLRRIELTAGQSWVGPSVVIGEIGQTRNGLDPNSTLTAAVMAATGESVASTRTLLAEFRLGADVVLRHVATLSPGERTRAELALLQSRGVNLLVLDEPTNHLVL